MSAYLEAFLFTSFTLLIVGVLAPVAVAVRVVRQERVVRLPRGFHVALPHYSSVIFLIALHLTLLEYVHYQLALANLHNIIQFSLLYKAIRLAYFVIIFNTYICYVYPYSRIFN